VPAGVPVLLAAAAATVLVLRGRADTANSTADNAANSAQGSAEVQK
jgi:hypothetical protein